MKVDKVCIGLTGYPGAGKTLLASEAVKRGIPVLNMGDVVREEALRRGLPPTRENMTLLMWKLRSEEGSLAVAKRILEKSRCFEQNLIVIDGLRTVDEMSFFRENFKKFILVVVNASREERFKRLSKRGRGDDPKSIKDLEDRDRAEEALGLAGLLAKGDRVILNEGPPEKALEEFEQVFKDAIRLDC
ncbi:AAA family ATPase [Candidatus Bathyarchaeota archaeon]|nr:AAA family ATPase [Candidatus Bathyarchaeota archaeon]MBS7618524.1 AAA family ATPase [Candidatus Bathyarchaeota archaeon]